MNWHLKRIPLVAHCYFGGAIPWLRYISMLSFARHNTEVSLRIYRPSVLHNGEGYRLTHGEITARMYKGIDYTGELSKEPNIFIVDVDFDKCGFTNNITETFKADYMRVLTMSTVGGIWIDSDIIFWDGIEKSYFNVSEMADICNVLHIGNNGTVYHSTGLVMASPERSMWKRAMELLSSAYNQLDTQSIASTLLNKISTSPAHISQKYGACVAFADDYVYPVKAGDFEKIFTERIDIFKWQTIGLHWFGGAEIAKDYTLNMDAKNYKQYNTTIKDAIDRSGVA